MELWELYLAETGATQVSGLDSILMDYHNWLKSKNMLRDDRGCETCAFDNHTCKGQVGFCCGPEYPKWKPCTITVSDAGDVAPGPTVEVVKNAYKRTLNCEGQRTPASYLLRDLYPSVFSTE